MEKLFQEKTSDVAVQEVTADDMDNSDDEHDDEREGFDELFHRISISNSIIEFEYYVKNPFKNVRNIRFCLESQALILYDGRHIPAECLLNISQLPTPNVGCLVSLRLCSKLKEKKWFFKDSEEASRFQVIGTAVRKNGGVFLDAFQQIKGNNKNNLSWKELRTAASKLDILLSDDQAQAMINLAVLDSKTYLQYLDFFSFFSTSAFVVDVESCILEWKQRLDGTLRGGGTRRSSIIITPKDSPTPIHKYQATLMKGEIVLNVIQQTRYYFVPTQAQKARSPFIGDIYITNYRLNFVSYDTFSLLVNSRREVPLTFGNVSLPLATIGRIEVLKNDTYSIAITGKDLRLCKILFEAKESFTKNFNDVICGQAFIPDIKGAFAFSNKESWGDRGWTIYNAQSEFERQGVLQEGGLWRLWSDRFTISPTYPSEFIIPTAMSITDILEASKFRSKGRLPALTWRNPRTGAVMARSAQPMVGVLGHKSLADKFLLNLYRSRGDLDDRMEIDRQSDFYVVDCRRSIAASANTAMGKGVEDVKNYTNTHLIFADIDNIHVMRGSLKSVEEALALYGPDGGDDSKFLSKIEDTNWLFHMNKILKASVLVAEKLEIERAGVLIHCSDGWDRTAQLCATAQLLLDPYYRTIEGFCVLIEKDWCSFGHKFYDRIGHYLNNDSQERSPVFLQWLDVVRILLEQFPLRFEFTENLLVFIMDAVFSCQFGNFLGNCDKDREDLHCRDSTKSVWSYVLFHRASFTNTSFMEHVAPLWPSTSPRKCNLWERYFFRWIPDMHPRECSGLSWKSDWGTNLAKKEISAFEVQTTIGDDCNGDGDLGTGNNDTEPGPLAASTISRSQHATIKSCADEDPSPAKIIKTSRVLTL